MKRAKQPGMHLAKINKRWFVDFFSSFLSRAGSRGLFVSLLSLFPAPQGGCKSSRKGALQEAKP